MKKDYNANTLPTKVIKKRCNEKRPKKRTQWWLYPLYLLYPILIHFFRYSNLFIFYIVYIPICGLSFFLITKSVKVSQFRQFQLLLFHLTLMSIQKLFQVFQKTFKSKCFVRSIDAFKSCDISGYFLCAIQLERMLSNSFFRGYGLG